MSCRHTDTDGAHRHIWLLEPNKPRCLGQCRICGLVRSFGLHHVPHYRCEGADWRRPHLVKQLTSTVDAESLVWTHRCPFCRWLASQPLREPV